VIHSGGASVIVIEVVTMNEQDNVSLIREIYAAFGAGDVPTIMGSVADNAQ
jgi:hypothetical protein